MFTWLLKKTIGTKNDRELKKLGKSVDLINAKEREYQRLSDEEIRAKTDEFRERLRPQVEALRAKEEECQFLSRQERLEATEELRTQLARALDDLLADAFAAVKNVCRRLADRKTTLDVCGHAVAWIEVPYDVQLMGAIALHQGKITEMATGEGKTLVATMPLYLNALTGYNVHLVTVNDYLARRDAQWMGKIYEFLGITVGCLQNQMGPPERKEVYSCDITYGTNSEFGFDYLRDNGMATSPDEQVQRGHYYTIIDEVDSILIDEARTPLIITAPVSASTHKFAKLKPSVAELSRKETMLCNRLMKEAKELFEDAETQREAGIKLYQVSKGAPKNRQLLKMIEAPDARRLLDRASLELISDARKDEAEAVREELYFAIDERGHEVELTDRGRLFLSPDDPEAFVIPDMITLYQQIDEDGALPEDEKVRKKKRLDEEFAQKSETLHNISQLLRAYSLFERDVEYVVQDNRVVIVDEFTGRLLPGRRYSDGLHQALQAKEGVTIENETQTFATITIQNYFRLYEKLAGMTGTAETEANEFNQIYGLEVLVVPTNEPVRRIDCNDAIYKTKREKYAAFAEEVARWHAEGRPMLIGTISVDTSEILSRYLRRKGIPHSVLNAKYHEKEAEIITRAGHAGAVTIATNMAGRGTDIKLGPEIVKCEKCIIKPTDGNVPREVIEEHKGCIRESQCGLYVIGTERHEARRIDRQLRGRCARQGDPGGTKFFISLEDDLMRLFGSERIARIMTRVGLDEGEELSHPLLNKSIESAQKRVEQRNFAIRKHTLEYDDVMNKQREIIYEYRTRILRDDNLSELLFEFMNELLDETIELYLVPKDRPEEWNLEGLVHWINSTFPARLSVKELSGEEMDVEGVRKTIFEKTEQSYDLKEKIEGPDVINELLRYVMLSTLDRLWKDHLYDMDNLRESVRLRAYGQKDPLIEFKQEGYDMFVAMTATMKKEIVSNVFRTSSVPSQVALPSNLRPQDLFYSDASTTTIPEAVALSEAEIGSPAQKVKAHTPYVRQAKKVGRNEPCPCGSGKKYKKCCGANQ
ncbi:preprotein translocase subunit SecA [bacterium]|nr:preprotein translocase subunit SecA [bacterium]